jgi:CubicO group peptidase (beta-lactamase class C family)
MRESGRMAEINGYVAQGYEAVRQAFADNFTDRGDVGACTSLVVRGETVVDLWGGHADAERTKPWEEDTIINVWSSTKTMMFLTCLLLMDRGELDPYAPVSRYWPEFAANGKGKVEVRHLMSHTAGLPSFTEPVTEADFWDHDKCAALLAAQAPWWEPGTKSGYHAITQGYLLGEVVKRITGVSLGTFFRTELAEPLGADFHIGTGPEHDHRIALVIPATQPLHDLPPGSIAERTFTRPPIHPSWSWTIPWRRCESPAGNGHGNARSMARVQSVLSHGGEIDGKRFLSEATCRRVFEVQSEGFDECLVRNVKFGLGYGLETPENPVGPGACYWGGWGGSLVVNDLDHRYTFAYAMNRMGEGTQGDERAGALLTAAMPTITG